MANMRYFSDVDGESVHLVTVRPLPNAKFAEQFPGVPGRRVDAWDKWVGWAKDGRVMLPVTRVVEFKAFPSRHECDARCVNATGRIMKCECSCGGKNHGKGSPLVAEAVLPV